MKQKKREKRGIVSKGNELEKTHGRVYANPSMVPSFYGFQQKATEEKMNIVNMAIW